MGGAALGVDEPLDEAPVVAVLERRCAGRKDRAQLILPTDRGHQDQNQPAPFAVHAVMLLVMLLVIRNDKMRCKMTCGHAGMWALGSGPRRAQSSRRCQPG